MFFVLCLLQQMELVYCLPSLLGLHNTCVSGQLKLWDYSPLAFQKTVQILLVSLMKVVSRISIII